MTPKHKINDELLSNAEIGKFALFRRGRSGRGAKFMALHETEAKALEVANSHAAELVGEGNFDFTYYVVQIVNKIGFEHGRPVMAKEGERK